MLRPAKLFQPIYQLRQYVQHKLTELVVQQSILTSSIQQITATASVGNNVLPIITHQPPKPLIQNLQKQFPMINKACSPFLRNTPSTSIGTTSSLHYLRHQSQPAIGTYRAYSSSSTCFMKNMYISPSSTNPSIFSHLSSNGAFIKTPLGQQWANFNHQQYQQQKNYYEESPIVPYAKKQQKDEEMKSKKEFKKCNQPVINKKNNSSISQPLMKNEKKDDIILPPIEMKKEKKNNNNIKEKNLLCMQKDDDMMTIHSTSISTSINYYYIHVDLLPPPNTTNSLLMSMTSSSSTSSMNKKEKDWLPLSQDLMSFFISWKEKQQKYYQHFIQWIQFFVDKQFHFSITNGGQSLRLYFPKHIINKEQALAWLNDINQKFFDLQQRQNYKKKRIDDDDNEVLLPHWSLHHETRLVQEPLLPLGPDYFQGLQLFLDEIDDLFHHGPAFSKIN